MSYTIIAEQNREEVIFYEMYGSYQGEWIMATEKDRILRIYKDYYGSCSGCDSYEATFSYNDPVIDSEDTIKFVGSYEPFLARDIDELTYQDIYDGITMNNKDSWEFKKEDQLKLIQELCDKYGIES